MVGIIAIVIIIVIKLYLEMFRKNPQNFNFNLSTGNPTVYAVARDINNTLRIKYR